MRKNGTDALLHRYIKEIDKSLACPADGRSQILSSLKESVSTYLLDHPNATYEDITQRFGTPAQVADAFPDAEGMPRAARGLSLFRKVVLGVLIAAVLSAIVLGAVYVSDMHGFFHGHYSETVAYGTPPPPESGVRRY
ncbi:hypothetical protein D5272_03870 [bacterium D16-76]|nr:hypothetical protein [bacterium D16-76]